MSCKTLNSCVGCRIIPVVVWNCLTHCGTQHSWLLHIEYKQQISKMPLGCIAIHLNYCWCGCFFSYFLSLLSIYSTTHLNLISLSPHLPSSHAKAVWKPFLTEVHVDCKLLSAHHIWLFNSLRCRSFILYLNDFHDLPQHHTLPCSSLAFGFLAGSSSS